MSARPRTRGPVLGGPVAELRPSSCEDMADTPRGAARARWSPLEAVGALSLIGAWGWLLWRALEQLTGAR